MPTQKQLDINMESQMEFPHTRREDDPMYQPPKPTTGAPNGCICYDYIWDPNTDCPACFPHINKQQVVISAADVQASNDNWSNTFM